MQYILRSMIFNRTELSFSTAETNMQCFSDRKQMLSLRSFTVRRKGWNICGLLQANIIRFKLLHVMKRRKGFQIVCFFQNAGTIPGIPLAQGHNILNDLLKFHDTNLFRNNTVGIYCFPLQEAMLLKGVYNSQIAKINFQIEWSIVSFMSSSFFTPRPSYKYNTAK